MHLNKLYKAGSLLLIVLSLYVLVLAINAIKENKFIGGGVPSSNVITVSGEGEAFAVPDTAQFTYSVREERATVEEAQRVAIEKGNSIIAFLEEEGVEERDIKTLNYSVNPRYEYEREQVLCVTSPCPQPPAQRVLKGYVVDQTVRVKVRDTEEAGGLLGGIGELGASNISGLTFMIDDEDALVRDARKAAIEDAQDKAKELAKDLDVDLVRIVSFSEGGGYYPQQRFLKADFALESASDEALAPELPVGENTITSNVTITYEIR